ncbi:Uu.00g074830.m01.CDS01 [Anthostomella pinea]|uniref:ferroxidase n=1 Tax=Anthostomella pinea TaxID=933095 RepID=A0AAI8VVL5_9PEZI|nr:Uu.00g074830.m01.CDS01 [Anthostomella pinea]
MTRNYIAKLGRLASRGLTARGLAASSATYRMPFSRASNTAAARLTFRSHFSTSPQLAKPLEPDVLKAARPADLTDAEYHELADDYLDQLLAQYEKQQDDSGHIDVEYSAGVMHVNIPEIGEYVLNKQPPNKQIWLSSPKSGPKRYDYVVLSEGQDQKQDTASGGWYYLRDGTSLTELLVEETGIDPIVPPV